jgi:cysteinyl-tRNA synthetase
MRRIMQDYLEHASPIWIINLPWSWRRDLQEDLRQLRVLQLTVSTEGSEYKKEIFDFIQTLIDKGLAYASEGTFYFDGKHWTHSRIYIAM